MRCVVQRNDLEVYEHWVRESKKKYGKNWRKFLQAHTS